MKVKGSNERAERLPSGRAHAGRCDARRAGAREGRSVGAGRIFPPPAGVPARRDTWRCVSADDGDQPSARPPGEWHRVGDLRRLVRAARTGGLAGAGRVLDLGSTARRGSREQDRDPSDEPRHVVRLHRRRRVVEDDHACSSGFRRDAECLLHWAPSRWIPWTRTSCTRVPAS